MSYDLKELSYFYNFNEEQQATSAFMTDKLPLNHPEAISADDFQAELEKYNAKLIEKIKNILESSLAELTEQADVCLAVTGSDGRAEKMNSTSSPCELIAIVRYENQSLDPLVSKISAFIKNNPLFHHDLEIKNLENDMMMLFKNQKGFKDIPSRALDAAYVIGSQEVFEEYKAKFFEELRDPQNSKSLGRFKNSTVYPEAKILKDFLHGEKKSKDIDLETGELYYDGQRIKATKYPLLRVGQYVAVYAICKAVKEGKINFSTFKTLPQQWHHRISWLRTHNIIKLTENEEISLQKTYALSLIWFGRAQQLFAIEGVTQTYVDPTALNHAAHDMYSFGTKIKGS